MATQFLKFSPLFFDFVTSRVRQIFTLEKLSLIKLFLITISVMDTAFNYFQNYNLLDPLHEPSLSNSNSTASMMSSNVSISDFEEHQFLVNSLQHTIHNSRPNTHVDTINNGYAACQQQTMQNNLAVMQGQGQDGMFEPSFGFATLSPRSSRLATGTTCLTDFGYLAADTTDHKQYNWLYDSMDAYMPTMANVENDLFVNTILQQQDGVFTNEAIETAIGGMSCNYVSMNVSFPFFFT